MKSVLSLNFILNATQNDDVIYSLIPLISVVSIDAWMRPFGLFIVVSFNAALETINLIKSLGRK